MEDGSDRVSAPVDRDELLGYAWKRRRMIENGILLSGMARDRSTYRQNRTLYRDL